MDGSLGAKGVSGSFSAEPSMQAQAESKDGGDMGMGDGMNRPLRPTTARRRPPRVKDGAKEMTAKEAAPSGKRPEGILIDGADDDDDDEVVDEERLADTAMAESKTSGSDDQAGPQSKIVKDIMARQAEQEAASKGMEAQVI